MTVRTESAPAAGHWMRFALRVRAIPLTYFLLGAVILAIDLVTGRLLMFPILFVVPVALAAWYCGARTAYALAVLLPAFRVPIAVYLEGQPSVSFAMANAAVRSAVLLFIAFLVARQALHVGELRRQAEALVTICAWSRTVELEGEWVSFEEYLRRRFGIRVSHGISPAELQRLEQELGETPESET